jgi:MFS family permease
MTPQATTDLTPPRRLGPVVQYALLAGPLLSMLDSSIVNVAVEPIARELHASLATVQWTVSGYLLALGTGLAGTAYLARRFGTLPGGFTAMGQFGELGKQDVAVWTSPDGVSWKQSHVSGLSEGSGIRAITALVPSGATLTGIGSMESRLTTEPVILTVPSRR